MNSIIQKYHKFILKTLLIAIIFISFYVITAHLIPFFAPFILAAILSLINEPLISFLEKKLNFSRNLASIVSLLITIVFFGGLLVIGVIKIYNELMVLQYNIPEYINNTSNQISIYYNSLPISITDTINKNLKSFAPKIEQIVASMVTSIISTISSFSKMAIFVSITLLSTYFISSDRRQIRNFVYRQLPKSWSKIFPEVKHDTLSALLGYFKALLLLMTLTFVEVTTGLIILNTNYALLMGLIVAISDLIPVFGTSIVFIPWIVLKLITGDLKIAFGLTIIYLFGIIMRQILEPKIIGTQIGVHPLAILFTMYIGLNLFGVLGVLLAPICLIVLKSLQTSGILNLWND